MQRTGPIDSAPLDGTRDERVSLGYKLINGSIGHQRAVATVVIGSTETADGPSAPPSDLHR